MDTHIDGVLAPHTGDSRFDPELWEFEYKVRPYLKNIENERLDKRYVSLIRNLYCLATAACDDLGLDQGPRSTWWWLKKRAQILKEYNDRGREPPDTSQWRSASSAHEAQTAQLLASTVSCRQHVIVKYGDESWLRKMLDAGETRVAPASSYKEQEKDDARFDDELRRERFSFGEGVRVTTPNGVTGPIIGDLKRTTQLRTNFHVFCASTEFDPSLFEAFRNEQGAPANACLVIWDTKKFVERLQCASPGRFCPHHFFCGAVRYFDPYEGQRARSEDPVSATLTKDFYYTYQREYRFVWLPQVGYFNNDLKVEWLHLGSLSTIAGLFRADGKWIGGTKEPL